MKYTLLIAPLLAATALGQADEVYKTLGLGDRVQITFRSGGTITGQLVRNPVGQPQKPAPKAGETAAPEAGIDYAKQPSLTVDMSWEYPGLEGSMTVNKKEIKDIRKLQSLDKETMDRLMKQRAEIRKALERQNDDNKAKSAKTAKEGEEERLRLEAEKKKELELKGTADSDLERLKRAGEGLKLLKKFPPEAGWGPDKLKEITQKTQRKNAVVTPEESEFVLNYQLWSEAKTAMDAATKKKENSPEEKKN